MEKHMDTIQFESRDEIREVSNALDKYFKQNPKELENKTLKKLYDLLDMMDMEW